MAVHVIILTGVMGISEWLVARIYILGHFGQKGPNFENFVQIIRGPPLCQDVSPQRLNTALIVIPLLFFHVVDELSGCNVLINGECVVCNLDECDLRTQLQSQGKAQYDGSAI